MSPPLSAAAIIDVVSDDVYVLARHLFAVAELDDGILTDTIGVHGTRGASVPG